MKIYIEDRELNKVAVVDIQRGKVNVTTLLPGYSFRVAKDEPVRRVGVGDQIRASEQAGGS